MAKRTASAKKQARAGARRTVRNRAVRSEVKTLIVKARKSVADDSSGSAAERLAVGVSAVKALDRAAAKGILHPRNAARRKSRLAKQMAAIAAAASAEKAAATAKAASEARPSRARRLLGRS